MSVTYSGPLVDWWNMEHPGEPFPSPREHPEMFEGLNLNIVDNVYYGTPSCSNGMVCPYGIFDYECQVSNSCYLNLIQLVATILLIGGIIYGILYAIVFLCKHRQKLNVILYPIGQTLCCIKNGLSSLNCDFIRKYNRNKTLKKQASQREELQKKMKKMGIELDLDSLTQQKQREILGIVKQYQVIDDEL